MSISLEQALEVVMGGYQGDVQLFNACNEIVAQAQFSPDGLQMCIAGFDGFVTPNQCYFAAKTIYHWLRNNFEAIPGELHTGIQQIIFTNRCIKEFPAEMELTNTHQLFDNSIVQCQKLYLYKSYPDIWPGFWAAVLEMHPKKVLDFLGDFCSDLSDLDGDGNAICVLQRMAVDGSDCAVVSFLVNCIKSGDVTLLNPAFSVLTQLANSDAGMVAQSPEVMEIVVQGMNNPLIISGEDTMRAAHEGINVDPRNFSDIVNIFAAVVNVGMVDPGVLASLDIPSKVQVLCTTDNPEILSSVANLISVMGRVTAGTEACIGFYQMALTLFGHPNASISHDIFPFIQAYAEDATTPFDQALPAMDASVERLAMWFANVEPDMDKMDNFCSNILKFIDNIFDRITKAGGIEAFVGWINSKLEGAADLPHVTAVLHIFIEINRPIPCNIEGLVARFMPLFKQGFGQMEYLAFTAFAEFIIRRIDMVPDKSIYNGLFMVLYSNLPDPNPVHRIEYCNLIIRLAKLGLAGVVGISPEQLMTLIGTFDPDMIETAAKLVKLVDPAVRIALLQQIFGVLSEDAKQRGSLQFIFRFIKHSHHDAASPEEKQAHISVLQSLIPVVAADDYHLSDIILNMAKIGKADGIRIFMESQVSFPGPESLGTFLKEMNNFIEVFDGGLINGIIATAAGLLPHILTSVSNWDDSCHEANIAIIAVRNAFVLAKTAFRTGKITPETVGTLMVTVQFIFENLLECKKLIHPLVDFFTDIAKIVNGDLLNILAGLLPALLTHESCMYDPHSDRDAINLLRKTAVLHRSLYQMTGDAFVAGLRQSRVFQDDNVIGAYLSILAQGGDIDLFLKTLWNAIHE